MREVSVCILSIGSDDRRPVTTLTKPMDITPDNMSDMAIIRRAKALMYWTGVVCKRVGSLQRGRTWILLEPTNQFDTEQLMSIKIKETT